MKHDLERCDLLTLPQYRNSTWESRVPRVHDRGRRPWELDETDTEDYGSWENRQRRIEADAQARYKGPPDPQEEATNAAVEENNARWAYMRSLEQRGDGRPARYEGSYYLDPRTGRIKTDQGYAGNPRNAGPGGRARG